VTRRVQCWEGGLTFWGQRDRGDQRRVQEELRPEVQGACPLASSQVEEVARALVQAVCIRLRALVQVSVHDNEGDVVVQADQVQEELAPVADGELRVLRVCPLANPLGHTSSRG
jgi:hypothetical protein